MNVTGIANSHSIASVVPGTEIHTSVLARVFKETSAQVILGVAHDP